MKNAAQISSTNNVAISGRNTIPEMFSDIDKYVEALKSDNSDQILSGLQYFITLLHQSKNSVKQYVENTGIIQNLLKFFYETSNIAILIETLHLLTIFLDTNSIILNEDQFDEFYHRILDIFTSHEIQVYEYLFDYIVYFCKNTPKFTDFLIDNYFIDDLCETWIGSTKNFQEILALNAKFVSELLSTQFTPNNLDQFENFFNTVIEGQIHPALPYIMKSISILYKTGFRIKFHTINKKFFKRALNEIESNQRLLDLLVYPESKQLFEALWTAEFRNLLIGSCVILGQDMPEYFIYFLIKITDLWKPLSDDDVIKFLFLIITKGTFVQRFAAGCYIRKLFSFADLDFIIDLVDQNFVGCLISLASDSNDQLLDISVEMATMILITFMKCEYEFDSIPLIGEYVKIIDDIDEDELSEVDLKKIEEFRSYLPK